MDKPVRPLRDFLYLDLAKLASIYSQLTGGLVTGTEATTGSEHDDRNIRKYDLKVFKPEFGGASKESSKLVESRVMHHDLFNETERLLFESNYAVDINDSLTVDDFADETANIKLRKAFYIRATGWSLIEDYERIKELATRHSDIIQLLNSSIQANVRERPEYKVAAAQIEKLRIEGEKLKDKNEKAQNKSKLRELSDELERLVSTAGHHEPPAKWIVEGLHSWVDTFMPGAVYFHLYPFDDYEAFHFKANLIQANFLGGDQTSIDFAYTSRPNVKLTVFGLITSLPFPTGHPFDPMREFQKHKPTNDKDDPIGFEGAIRGIFRGFDGLSRFGTFERFPNATIYPLAVYRDIRL